MAYYNDPTTWRLIILDAFENQQHQWREQPIAHCLQADFGAVGCTDAFRYYLQIEQGQVKAIYYQGQGCVIATSSNNLLITQLLRQDLATARTIITDYQSLLHGKTLTTMQLDRLQELIVFSRVHQQPNRIVCASAAAVTLAPLLCAQSTSD